MITPVQTLFVAPIATEMYLIPDEQGWYTFQETLELLGEKGWLWSGHHPHKSGVLVFQRKEPTSSSV